MQASHTRIGRQQEAQLLRRLAAPGSNSRAGMVAMDIVERVEGLMAQCAVQPHLGAVYADLLLQARKSAELYIKVPALAMDAAA